MADSRYAPNRGVVWRGSLNVLCGRGGREQTCAWRPWLYSPLGETNLERVAVEARALLACCDIGVKKLPALRCQPPLWPMPGGSLISERGGDWRSSAKNGRQSGCVRQGKRLGPKIGRRDLVTARRAKIPAVHAQAKRGEAAGDCGRGAHG
jgi:hypothetical protein